MLVFHLVPDEGGRAHLWAEDSTLPPQHPPKPGRPPKVPDPREHPFAAASNTLRTACEELDGMLPVETFEETSSTLLLPSASADFSRLQALRESMPPLARSLVTGEVRDSAEEANDWGDANVRSARDGLVRTLDSCVDATVRQRLSTIDPANLDGGSPDVRERWLAALTRSDGTIDADRGALADLGQQLDDWTHSVETAGEQGVRLCLRLWAPEPEIEPEPAVQSGAAERAAATTDIEAVSPDGWELELLLQSPDDPSLLVEASTVWESAEATTEVLERHLDGPQEALLEELGRAASIYPRLESALDERTPTTVELTAGEADEFLREYTEVLEGAGFGVILPAWWNEPERRLGARLAADADPDDEADSDDSTSNESSVGGIGVDQLCDVQWDVVLGGERVSEAELEELAALKMPLVRVRGQWVSLREGDVENALALYEETDGGRMTVAEALQADTGLADDDPGLPIVDNQFEGTLSDLFDSDVERWVEAAETPAGFDGQLRPDQQRGLGWISYLESLGFGGCLADDMGLGKTIQILARLVEDQATDRTYRIGQTDDVQVHKLICEGTVKEAIDRTIEQKRDLADRVLAEGDEWLTELSDDELREMVELSEGIHA